MAAHLDLFWTDDDTQTALARLLARTSTHEPVAVLLHKLLQFAERLTPEMRCSILLADLLAGVLRASAAPSLPAAYVRAIDHLPIVDGVGSCGTAAARREPVIVCDIAQSPLWRDYAALAAAHGLGACWSVPLLDGAGELLGTCAMYYAQPRTPTKAEADLIRISGGLAAMIIQRHRDTERVAASGARYRLLATELQQSQTDLQAILDHVPARITSWNLDYANQFANRVAESQFGIAQGMPVGKFAWELLGEKRFAQAKPYIDAALAGEPQSHEPVEAEPDGSLRYSQVDYVPKRHDEEVVGLYALATDVTELRNSYERIRELAQHVETVREEERRSIAHWLHEGIAQDLFAMKLRIDQLRKEVKCRAGVVQACQELTAAMEKCMADTRQIANELLPAALGHLQLTSGIEEHAPQIWI